MSATPNPPDNREKEEHTELLVCGVPSSLKTEFKLHCVREGLSMSKVLVEMIRRLVKGSQP